MKWILICLLLKSDGSVPEPKEPPRFTTEAACQKAGQAWQAQVNHSENGVGTFECVRK